MSQYKAKFASFGMHVPKKIVNNFDLEKIVDTTDEWIRTRTGMFERHHCTKDEAATDIAVVAATKAIENSQVKYKDIDLIITATVTGDYNFPSASCILQKRLGLGRIPAFDVSAGCTGFVYALDIAKQFVENGTKQNVLVTGVDILTKITNWNDRGTCVLFGDGAGSTILTRAARSDISEIMDSITFADGSLRNLLILEGGG